MKIVKTWVALFTAAAAFGAAPAAAQEPPYEAKLMRLSEVLGSVHFLRQLCGEPSAKWRDSMNELIKTENPQPDRKARLIASFNHGYRSFDGVYVRCTPAAIDALNRFMGEGETLSGDIATRYAN